MRQIILDTETTGLEPREGHRVVEVGCVTLADRQIREDWHRYLNPDRDMDSEAAAITGITRDQLEDSPRFPDVVDDFLAHIEGAEIVAHNASFDIGFLDHELSLMGHPKRIADVAAGVVDTLAMARKLHAGLRNSLDALCKRYDVDNTIRRHHGALLDAHLLTEVYLRMTGGQIAMSLDLMGSAGQSDEVENRLGVRKVRVVSPSADERAAHAQRVEQIRDANGHCLFDDG